MFPCYTEFREADFHEIRRNDRDGTDCKKYGDDRSREGLTERRDDRSGKGQQERALISFNMPKATVASTPILRHFDPHRAMISAFGTPSGLFEWTRMPF